MVKITKDEAKALRTMGVRDGENGISHTVKTGKHRKYYLCEHPKNIAKLNKIRNK